MTVRHVLWSVCALLGLGIVASAQPPIQIKQTRFGFPAANNQRRVRVGAWTPIYVTLKAGKTPVDARGYELVLQTTDANGAANFYATGVPTLAPNQERVALSYVRIDNGSGNVTVRVRRTSGGTVAEARDRYPESHRLLRPSETLYLTIGARLPQLEKSLVDREKKNADTQGRLPDVPQFAHVDRLEELPDRWFGYDSVDVVILPTDNPMVRGWLDAQEQAGSSARARFDALVEWVQRGGHLLLTVGKNYERLKKTAGFSKLINASLDGSSEVNAVGSLAEWAQLGESPIRDVELAHVTPDRGVTVLAAEKEPPHLPVLLEAPCSRGRVMLLTLDVESSGFADWQGQSAFWYRIHESLRPRLTIQKETSVSVPELGNALQRSLETFEAVPVISFGWIVLLIIGYIIIIGPLEYLFLKKVLKKVELTWITFPTLVVLISVTAYFAAYSIKGEDLRIKKVDVVDIDLHHNTVTTTTWVSVFSPRLQNYVLGVEPVWGKSENDSTSTVLMSAMSPADNSLGGSRRPAAQSLFRKPYEYVNHGQGLRDVPIPVWSARSFVAKWRGTGADKLFEADDLQRPEKKPELIEGEMISQLPIKLTDVSLHYRGAWFDRGDSPLIPGQPWRLGIKGWMVGVGTQRGDSPRWLSKSFGKDVTSTANRTRGSDEIIGTAGLMKSILFHDHPGDPLRTWRNSGLRDLDQGWRLQPFTSGGDQYPEELIIVGRMVQPSTPAEAANESRAMPTRLWMGKLPGSKEERPRLSGYLTQETYVRIFVPVPRRPAKK